ncbi:DNA topoisomerase IB, partial [Curtobacterium flaccumfaciens]|nr:DNA topoisomerase IB [Curtobacterium flaccumfaciens]
MTRLRRSATSGRGYHRVRSGRGFSFRDPDGNTVTDPDERRRLEEFVIPPAWDDVWISPYANGHILA